MSLFKIIMLKRAWSILHTTIELVLGGLIFIYLSIGMGSAPYIYALPEELPNDAVIVVLGTSKKTHGGKYSNQYFANRINTVVDLYQKGKARCILVSGDNSEKYYNEPVDMKKALIERGVNREDIYLDYAGFSTYESVVRAKKIFGLTKCILVSQQFHVERAVWLARSIGLEAYGFAAKDTGKKIDIKVKVRELFARSLAFWDWVFKPKPRYLGKMEKINCK